MAMTVGFAVSLVPCVLLLGVVTVVRLVVRRRPLMRPARLARPGVPVATARPSGSSARGGADRDARRRRRRLGRRAAPARARPPRRRPGAAGRAVAEPRHGRRDLRRATPSGPQAGERRPADERRPRWATCARSCAASTRRCSPTAGSSAPSRRSRSTWRCRWTVEASLPGRPPAPVESAVYFAVAECLANIGKHSGAQNAWIRLAHDDGVLRADVGDDGARRGGSRHGHGHAGGDAAARQPSTATMMVSSPVGGPTLVTLEVPCGLSSPKTTPSSAPD